jgi:hypothetical protein
MPSRTARWIATALAAFLFAQPVSLLAFSLNAGGMSCCKDGSMSCCRRSHHHPSGLEFSARDCCEQCQVAVRQSQPVAETMVQVTMDGGPAPLISRLPAPQSWIPSDSAEAPLFERPPPSFQ